MSIYFPLILTFLNSTASQAARVVLPLNALYLEASALTVGVLGATFSMLPLLLSVPAGRFADRFGSRWLLIFGTIGGGLGMLLPYFYSSLTAIFLAAAMIGLAFGIFNVILQNLVGHLSDADTRAKNFSNYSLANAAANFIAPLIGGFSIEHAGYQAACLYLALLTLVPLVMLATHGEARPPGAREGAAGKGGVLTLMRDRGIRNSLTASGLLLTAQDLYRVYMPVYGHSIGLTPSTIGIVLAAFPAASFFVRLLMQRLVARFQPHHLLAYSFYMAALCLLLIPLFENAFMLSLVSFVFGLGMGCGQPIITMLMYSNSPKGRSGEAMGLRMTVVHFTRLVGPVALGAIGSAFGLLAMFWFNVAMMAGGGWLSQHSEVKSEER